MEYFSEHDEDSQHCDIDQLMDLGFTTLAPHTLNPTDVLASSLTNLFFEDTTWCFGIASWSSTVENRYTSATDLEEGMREFLEENCAFVFSYNIND